GGGEAGGGEGGGAGGGGAVLLLAGFLVRPADPVFRIAEPLRMRNARGVLGDVAVIGERRDHFSVPEARRAQDQPRGLEDGDTAFSESLRWDVFQSGHGRLLGFERFSESTSKSTQGEPAYPPPPL